MLLDQQPRDPAGEIVELAIGPAAVIVDDRERHPVSPPLSNSAAAFSALGIIELGQIEAELRKLLRRGQAIVDERVAHQSGTTAVVSISTLAAPSTRPLTSTSAIAG